VLHLRDEWAANEKPIDVSATLRKNIDDDPIEAASCWITGKVVESTERREMYAG
jgi:hypothetical protein